MQFVHYDLGQLGGGETANVTVPGVTDSVMTHVCVQFTTECVPWYVTTADFVAAET